MFGIFKRKYKEEDWFKVKTYKSNIKIKYPFEINKDDVNLIIKGIALGDIAGSIYEGFYSEDRSDYNNIYDTMYTNGEYFTDDTVMAIGTYKALESSDYEKKYREMFYKYPNAGYGPGFKRWCLDDKAVEYNSYGNGSAMRVGPIGILEKEEDVIREAIKSASVTHNHPEGVKGAVITAVCIHLLLKGASKEDILRYVSKFYTEENIINPKLSLKEYHNIKTKIPVEFSVTCMHTVPLAVRCFYESRNFEDCITKAIMASMDADTCAAIAGSLAAVYYKTFNANTTYAWGNKYKEEINAMINN